MTALVWDQSGERFYQAGIDRGVLYLEDGTAAAWNGLISVEEIPKSETKSFYFDGVKYLEILAASDFEGKLKAYTYPDEFEAVSGITAVAAGFEAYNQPARSFNLSYRTKIGSVEGNFGYRIHILYNLIANPDSYAFETADDSGVKPVEFAWTLTGTPPAMENIRPTVHLAIDSIDTPVEVLQSIENQLYGTAATEPSLLTFQDISQYFGYQGGLVVIDHGNGRWSAVDETDSYISMIDATTFQIDGADATYLDAVKYELSSTSAGWG